MQDNNTTLNKDINLIERDCGYWDYEFQYGDLVLSKDKQSLRNGLIIACLTSWNYLNRQGNPTYSVFGNKAYWELKKKKSSMREYLIRQYFIEVLNRIRRVHRIVDINVIDHPTDPNAYNVKFTVEAINNEIITGQFNIGTDNQLPSSNIIIDEALDYASNEQPLNIRLTLRNEYGTGIKDELLYVYLQEGQDNDYRFIQAIGLTDSDGNVMMKYVPKRVNDYNSIYFTFKGNNEYTPSNSDKISFKTDIYTYYISFFEDNITTTTNSTPLSLKVCKKPLSTGKYEPIPYALVEIVGSDRETYKVNTDENGEAYFKVNTYSDTSFTAKYKDKETSASVEILKVRPVIILDSNTDELYSDEVLELYVHTEETLENTSKTLNLQLYDNNELIKTYALTDKDLTITLTDLSVGEHEFYIISEPNSFYEESHSRGVMDTETVDEEDYDETITVTVSKHDIEMFGGIL